MPVLVVENDVNLANSLVQALSAQGIAGEAVHDSEAAIRELKQKRFSVVLLDLLLPKMNGPNIVEFLKSDAAVPPEIIAMTDADASTFAKLDRSVVRRILFKPLDVAQVAAYVAARRSR